MLGCGDCLGYGFSDHVYFMSLLSSNELPLSLHQEARAKATDQAGRGPPSDLHHSPREGAGLPWAAQEDSRLQRSDTSTPRYPPTRGLEGSSGGGARREEAQGRKPCPCKDPAQPSWLPGCPRGHSWGTRATPASPGTGDHPALVTAQEHLQDIPLLSHTLRDGSQSSLHSQETPGKKPL